MNSAPIAMAIVVLAFTVHDIGPAIKAHTEFLKEQVERQAKESLYGKDPVRK